MRFKEGKTIIDAPDIDEEGFPPSSNEVFFNPKMESNRDLAVAIVGLTKPSNYFDANAATGARAVRVANEVNGVSVFSNDVSKKAIEYIKKNKELNNISNLEISNKDSKVVFLKKGFEFIDLDPFGSPVPFLETAITSLNEEGFLAVTATDTAPLCGSHIKAGMRRYGSRSLRTPYHKEIGARILVGKVIRKGLQQDKALLPMITYYKSHYFRVYFKLEEGAQKANELMEKIGFIQHCFDCGKRLIVEGLIPNLKDRCRCGGNLKSTGPLFLGKIQQKDFIRSVIEEIKNRELGKKNILIVLLNTLHKESGLGPTFFNIHKVSQRLSKSAPKTKELLNKLRELGFEAEKTHFDDLGFKTDAGEEEIEEVFNLIF